MIAANNLQGVAADALIAVRAYVGSDPIKCVIELMDALEAQYKEDLENVTVDRLIPLQTALRQVVAIKRSILADSHLDPKIL